MRELRLKQAIPHLLAGLILAAGVFSGWSALALVALIALEAYLVWLRGEPIQDHLLPTSPYWLTSLSVLVMALLAPKPLTQAILIGLYTAWRVWFSRHEAEHGWLVATLMQFLALDALFLAAEVWQWGSLVVVVATWGIGWLVANRALEEFDDRATKALASAWALVSAECAWVFSLWMVSYIVLGDVIVVAQAAVVLTALGYCMGGIYASHRRSQLSRNRLIEYLLIGLFMMVIVIAGTKWNGVI